MRISNLIATAAVVFGVAAVSVNGQGSSVGERKDGKRLFERETFGGNGRTCLTCHSRETGTLSPEDVARRFEQNPADPLFLFDGSDDGQGHGVTRIMEDATILLEIPLPPNVRLGDDPDARSVVVRRGIGTTLNTPALDPVLMSDGRRLTLQDQALGAIQDHTQTLSAIGAPDLDRLREFQLTDDFFSSPELRSMARGGIAPQLPLGNTESERRGRRFFEDRNPILDPTFKEGSCAVCHSGPLLNQTNEFLPATGAFVPPGTRFQNVLVSEFNGQQFNRPPLNPVHDFIFTNPADGSETHVYSPDPGRALITGSLDGFRTFDQVNAFKISILWGVKNTAPYFHDNSARTLEEVVAHYTRAFAVATNGLLMLTPQDEADIVAYLKLL